MYQDIVDGKYKTKLPFVSTPPSRSVNRVIMDLAVATDEQIAQARADKAEYEKKWVEAKEMQKAFRDDEARLETLFKNDLFEFFDVKDNPKADLLYSKCYDLGHSGGMTEVYSKFDDLVDLIR
jgi:hypothetical protein